MKKKNEILHLRTSLGIIKFGFDITIEEFFSEGFDSIPEKKKRKK